MLSREDLLSLGALDFGTVVAVNLARVAARNVSIMSAGVDDVCAGRCGRMVVSELCDVCADGRLCFVYSLVCRAGSDVARVGTRELLSMYRFMRLGCVHDSSLV